MAAAQKVALVIGVGPGLGAALARRFAKGGFQVALMARSEQNLTQVQKEIEDAGGKALSIPCDVTKSDELKSSVEKVQAELGNIDTLLFNASARPISSPGGFGASVLEHPLEKVMDGFRLSVGSALVASQLVIPGMLKAGGGTILLTGATAALRGGNGWASLAMYKHALRALGQSMAREFHPQGIHVAHVIVDGLIDTPKIRELMPNTPKEKKLDPDEMADQFWWLYTQPRSVWSHEIDVRPHTEKF